MPGELRGDIVVVRDQSEGNRLYIKGNYGYPMKRGGLELDLFEALYLLESGRLEVFDNDKRMEFEQLFSYSSSNCSEFDIKYMVFRDLRSRGMVVKMESGDFDMSVFPRGMTMSNSRPTYLIRAVSERSAFDINMFASELEQTEEKGKMLIYGVADEEGDIVYYRMSHCDPRGNVFADRRESVKATLVRDRIFVFDPNDARRLYENGFFGRLIDNVLQMSMIEACYLMKMKLLTLVSSANGKMIDLETMLQAGRDSQEEFDLRLKAYSDARSKGLVVKTGFKYGTHFRAYEGSPEDVHARYLMHAVDNSERTMWPEISRAVRLSGGVKKDFLFAMIGQDVEYFEFQWIRP